MPNTQNLNYNQELKDMKTDMIIYILKLSTILSYDFCITITKTKNFIPAPLENIIVIQSCFLGCNIYNNECVRKRMYKYVRI